MEIGESKKDKKLLSICEQLTIDIGRLWRNAVAKASLNDNTNEVP